MPCESQFLRSCWPEPSLWTFPQNISQNGSGAGRERERERSCHILEPNHEVTFHHLPILFFRSKLLGPLLPTLNRRGLHGGVNTRGLGSLGFVPELPATLPSPHIWSLSCPILSPSTPTSSHTPVLFSSSHNALCISLTHSVPALSLMCIVVHVLTIFPFI